MYAVLSKRGIRLLLFSFLLLAAFLCEAFLISDISVKTDLRNPEARENFLSDLGVSVIEDTFLETTVTIPSVFSDVYLNYNQLQKIAGYDLSEYKGKRVTRYTYELANKQNTVINILCYKGRVIGGDISETALSGEMLPLIKQES